MSKCIQNVLNYLNKDKQVPNISVDSSEYSDFDYESLCELYYRNDWLKHQINLEGFENLWFDYEHIEDKKILIELLNNFKYLKQEDAAIVVKEKLKECINSWSLTPKNTLFVGFQKHKFPDGSQILLNLIKSILIELDPNWKEQNLLPNFNYGIDRIKKNGFPRDGLILKNVVLVDDFIGTGGTAKKNIETIKNLLVEKDKELELSIFAMATMKQGAKLIKPLKIKSLYCIELDKATNQIWSRIKRPSIRKRIIKMENILFEGEEPEPLTKFTLGYGKSEALYAWNRFNLPNNNFPIFWWNRYKDGNSRKPLFNRMQ